MEKALALAAALAVPALGPSAAQPVPLVSFPEAARSLSDWMSANGWESKREEPKDWSLEPGVLRLKGSRDSVLIGTEKGFPRTGSRLRITLKVGTVPRGSDLSRKSGDDAAVRVYLAFDRGGGFLKPPHTIAYTWAEKEPAGTLVESAYSGNMKYIVVGSGPTDWVSVEADLAADYKRAFPKESSVPRLKALLIKSDSNNTKTSTEAWLRSVELLP